MGALEDDGVDCATGGYYQTPRVENRVYRITGFNRELGKFSARMFDRRTGMDLGPVSIRSPGEFSSVPGNELPDWVK